MGLGRRLRAAAALLLTGILAVSAAACGRGQEPVAGGDDPGSTTPHLYEQRIKELFLEALGILMENREEIIGDCRAVLEVPADCGSIDAETWKSAQIFERKQWAGSGDFRIPDRCFCVWK